MTEPSGYSDDWSAIDAGYDAAPAAPARAGGGIAARALAARRGPDYLAGLNPEQRQAVETIDGPVLVLAGAGTGKTRVLTTRIAHILSSGRAWPSQILAVTFTNKAAREMRERIGHLIGGNVDGMAWLGTFHSICVKILRRHAELVGLSSGFSILDTDDQLRLMKQVIQAEGLDDKRWTARAFASLVDGWKNRALTPKDVPEGEARAFGNGKGRKLYAEYQDRLSVLNAADFGDLLLHVITLFKTHPDVLADYQRRFRFMLVDEYQDTNIAQYLWLRLLAQGNPNICCVGDDDQSIYGWRGAEVDNILRFEHDFAGATVIRLERNYRSTSHILAAASHLIAHNEGRLGKTLFTDDADPEAEPVCVASAWDSEEEARSIGDEIEALQARGHSLDQIAILVRASFQMREFEDRFVTLGLNYRVIGGPRFYERMEIRDAMAYFRCIAQPADDLAFERIVNTPKRGLGEATLKIVHELARAERIPLMQAAAQLCLTEEIKPKARKALADLLAAFERWRAQLGAMKHTELAEIVLDESGYTEMWRADRSAEAPGRLDNLKELVRSMEEFESLAGFLEHIALVMDRDNAEAGEAVSIMTLHSAKGLEFDTVFLPGWEEGLFPHQRALDESGRAGLEEERRLAYVGITRARKRAKIWFASNRRIHGLWQSSIPSRFLDELPEAHVEVVEPSTRYGGYGGGGYGASRFDARDPFQSGSYSTPGWQRAQRARAAQGGFAEAGGFARADMRSARARQQGPLTIEGELVARSVGDGVSDYAVGERVFHLKFGYGAIASIEGNKLTIDFEKAGRKRVLDSFVERH
ncbi:ATP-dependent helicase [Polymorphum gilvum]|uniref:DNA 3'-5' helicase n=1 Tax=Polymorphum gilvum (strain LMG 25793 / CGMCC 1.9160 / SL003B-26A1) TaxID=991905 RepID=F2J291_POLGS|nr:UvrD-helicase domain-containing protein [Polymorphum gilvum]ADZ69787.1 DNA helicase II protein [Polymorphum gilvum SL003B-26A1]